MDLQSNQVNPPYGLKDPVVKLERCDKIWKTLQLIRSLQDKHLEDIQDWIKREPIPPEKDVRKEPPMTFIPDKTLPLNLIGEPNLPRPYIKYQPIFNNGNESLPQFQLAEKSRVNLYHCEICSQEYCDYKRFTDHQEVVHGIVMPKKLVAKKERIQNNKNNGDLKNRQNSIERNGSSQSNKKSVADENVDLQTAARNTPSLDGIRCKLCGKCYKNIKKHMVDYHKIKCIGVLSKVTDQNSNFHKDQPSVIAFESVNYTLPDNVENNVDQTKEITSQEANLFNQSIANVSKRKLSMPSIGLRKRLRSVSSREEESDTPIQKEQLKCEICGKEYANYKTLCKHRVRHKSQNVERHSLEAKNNGNNSVDPASRRKTISEISVAKTVEEKSNDNDKVDEKIPKNRRSLIKERKSLEVSDNRNSNLLRIKENNSLQIKCACGRTFRTTSILANHKTGCKFINDQETGKSSDTRTGSDRDSGISITIKKKNNSYEIVSKDGSDEEPSRNFDNIEEPEMCEETSDSSSDNSDSSDFDDQLDTLVPEASKYSENHRILKLKFVDEDLDIDIEEDLSQDNFRAPTETEKTNISSPIKKQVPFLRDLCKKYLIQKGIMTKDETTHECSTCKIFLGSEEKLSKHVERHKKLMKRSCNCGTKFNSVKAFDDHVAAVHPQCVVCPYCKGKYKSIVGLGEHLCAITQGAPYTETFNETHPCPNCNIAFNNITWLDSHLRSKHLDPNLPFQCYQCLEKFPNEIARGLHAHKKHNHVSACSVCNQKFQSVKTRQKHEAYHRGVGFPCHICKKTYRSKKNKANHVRTVHSDFSNDKLLCFICEKSIKTKSFRKHVLRHNSVLECEMCKKVVYNFRNLERHIMDYHGNENYPRKKCTACGASFPTKEQLEAHVMVEKSVRNERYKDV